MSSVSNLNSHKYLARREAFRLKAAEAFWQCDPGAAELVAAAGELVSSLTLFLSGKDLSASAGRLYLGDLIVSFCRSHFIIVDLVSQGEVVESATLIRKQIELMARVRELSKPSNLAMVVGRTPNVRHLSEQLRRQYSEYSEIAHSASPTVMRLLGNVERDGKVHTPVYPEFDLDSYVALNHVGWLCVELYLCTHELYPTWFPDQALPEVTDPFTTIAKLLARPQITRS
jgi:hypothetical protein